MGCSQLRNTGIKYILIFRIYELHLLNWSVSVGTAGTVQFSSVDFLLTHVDKEVEVEGDHN